jgi:hypothetical protein
MSYQRYLSRTELGLQRLIQIYSINCNNPRMYIHAYNGFLAEGKNGTYGSGSDGSHPSDCCCSRKLL